MSFKMMRLIFTFISLITLSNIANADFDFIDYYKISITKLNNDLIKNLDVEPYDICGLNQPSGALAYSGGPICLTPTSKIKYAAGSFGFYVRKVIENKDETHTLVGVDLFKDNALVKADESMADHICDKVFSGFWPWSNTVRALEVKDGDELVVTCGF